jgi:glucose-1-phosphate thymidylyltransferase
MKGIILAGGAGTRLLPLTKITNKHLLPVYDKPMIYYPLQTLVSMGITDIVLVSGKGFAGHFVELLGSGREFGCRISYEVQEAAGGIAQALGLCERWAGQEKVAVILGDNIFDNNFSAEAQAFAAQPRGAKIFLKAVDDPHRFGVADIIADKIVNIEEKPKDPKTNYAVTGLYLYDPQVWDVIRTLKPSNRGELEITDVNNFYVQQGTMTYEILTGVWTDAGTFPSLLKATLMAAEKANKAANNNV